MDLHVITLDTGKKLGFKELKNKDWIMAAKSAAREAGEAQFVFQILVQQELLKALLIEIDGETLKAVQKEQIDDLLTPAEIMAAHEFMGSLLGKSKIVATEFKSSSGSK